MARRLVVSLILLIWFLALGLLVYRLQDRWISGLIYQRPYRDTLNLPEPEHAKILALGYDQFVSSILFLRVIQAFGAKLQHVAENPRELNAIKNVFYVIAKLDPHFLANYTFGNFVLGDEGRDQEAALELLEKGMDLNKDEETGKQRTYKLAYEAIFICLITGDLDRAKEFVYKASEASDCPEYVKRMEAYIDAKKGRFEIALERWLRSHLEAVADNDKSVQALTSRKIESTVNDWHKTIIDKAIDRYFEENLDYPARLKQLEANDYLGTGPVRMMDGPRLKKMLLVAEEARVPIENVLATVMKTTNEKGCIIEAKVVPRDLNGDPYLLVDGATIPIQQRPEVIVRGEVMRRTMISLEAIRRRLDDFYSANKRFPIDLTELPGMQGARPELQREDPAGMPWNYDPILGVVRSYVFPDL